MSDHSRESAERRELDSFAASHQAAAPAPAEMAALERVATDARQRANPRVTQWRGADTQRGYRLAGAALAAMIVIGAAVFAFTPRFDDSAFAREQAVAALLPSDEVFHARATYTSSGRNDEFGETAVRRQVWEDWIDVESQTTRLEITEASDDRIAHLSVRADGKTRTYASNFEYDEKKKAYVRLKGGQLLEGPSTDEITSPGGGLVDQLRLAISTGEAIVVDRFTDGGTDYWAVEWEVPAEEKGFDPTFVKATLRANDYALKHLELNVSGKNGNGNWTGKDEWDWDAWETVSRDSLPAEFFSLEAPVKLAKPGTNIEVQPVP